MFTGVVGESVVDAEYDHGFLGVASLADHEVAPESFATLWIVGWESRATREGINLRKDRIDLIIREYAVVTVDDPIELPLRVESESKLIVDILLRGDVFSPGELDFISISVDLRRWDD